MEDVTKENARLNEEIAQLTKTVGGGQDSAEMAKENTRLKEEIAQLTKTVGGGQDSAEMAREMSQYACGLCRSYLTSMEYIGKIGWCTCNTTIQDEKEKLQKEMTSAKVYLKRKYTEEFLMTEKECALQSKRESK